MKAIFEGESLHKKGYDVGDHGDSHGPFQLDVAGGRLGAQFQKETGKDPKDPKTLPDQAKWVANHLKKKFAANPNYNPGSEWFGYPRGKAAIASGKTHPNDDALGNKVAPGTSSPSSTFAAVDGQQRLTPLNKYYKGEFAR